jgi:hypothetical protein
VTRKAHPPPSTFRDRIKGLARLPGDRIEPAAKNFRTHDDRQRGALRGLLTEIGIAGAGVVWIPDPRARAALRKVDGPEAFGAWLATFTGSTRLIDGHLRREELAAQAVPVLVTDLDGPEAAKALATFDAVSDLAGVDAALLASLLGDIGVPEQKGTADLLTELRKHLPAARIEDDEEEPVIPTDALVAKWGTALGQLWVVPSLTTPGREHRLLCGDCRDPENVKRLHEGARVALGLHDPPYGIEAVKQTKQTLADGRAVARTNGPHPGRSKRFKTAHTKPFAPIEGDRGPFDPSHVLPATPRSILWGANNFAARLPDSKEWIVWDKREDMLSGSWSDAELAWVSPDPDKGHVRTVRHKWSGVCRSSEKGEQRLHPTIKPIFVQQQLVEWYSKPGDVVADWYMGAGAVIIACERSGRIGHGMDIAPAYLAATLERLSARGLTPRRELSDGEAIPATALQAVDA